ncbi:hypothetical protein GQ43DRAFT_449846 [Delitschia confertaspora ATCC 74209]|uniref:Uncharacterized protein n=1 Tax=Delitschia confertaspora ATCC 74209 TaxID=1513339 RepID=A0A9P4JJ07_9PLEO|nr:hypothetical protein GQ43DRAFT_449846 [Delitschia confertaspora ATCC 74209]
MYRRGDPRWNRTIQHLQENIESANESAQVNLWTFTHAYITPCFSSIGDCLHRCTAPCFPSREDRLRRNRGRSRGRAEISFDFYDDWEDDENDGLLGWENDELDRLLAGSSSYGGIAQPSRQRAMSYGTRRDRDGRFSGGRRKSAVQLHDGGADPTIIPSSSYFGFLGRLPFKLGGKVLRYKPSAADLTEHPGSSRRRHEEQQPLIEESDEDSERKGNRRNRSHTTGSGHTTDSLSSRGDIFPSEDEDDAVPLDDEFTMVLERRTTGEASSGKNRSQTTLSPTVPMEEALSLSEIKQEDERVRLEEEREIERRREGARQLALKRGLTAKPHPSSTDDAAQMSTSLIPFDPQATSESGSFTNDVEAASAIPLPERPSPKKEGIPLKPNSAFVGARLPHFDVSPG